MKKRDIFFILILGEIVAVFLLFILRNLGYFPDLIWATAVVVPILALFALFITYLIGKKLPVIFQFGKFASVGFANTAVDFGILNLLMLLFGITGGIYYSIFKGASFIGAVIHSYFWNKFWTFKKKTVEQVGGEFMQFLVVSLIGLGINIGIASLIVNYVSSPAGISATAWANIGAAMAIGVGLIWNFFGYKFIVFKK